MPKGKAKERWWLRPAAVLVGMMYPLVLILPSRLAEPLAFSGLQLLALGLYQEDSE